MELIYAAVTLIWLANLAVMAVLVYEIVKHMVEEVKHAMA